MPLCLALLLLTGLSACTRAGDKKLAPGGTEAGSLVTVTLEGSRAVTGAPYAATWNIINFNCLPLALTNSLPFREGVAPSIQLQLQEVKRDKASQFFPLMGKQAGGAAKQLSHMRTVGSVCSSTEDPTQAPSPKEP
ncbi:tachykinin-4 [Myotis daubentonii]|uniref:tachykinin-4 n=1 Tax=Myotis daubentonii TaxID=98922 RepID=UPI002873561A|nr:tachykinin-4 [Myotis daubentonii]